MDLRSEIISLGALLLGLAAGYGFELIRSRENVQKRMRSTEKERARYTALAPANHRPSAPISADTTGAPPPANRFWTEILCGLGATLWVPALVCFRGSDSPARWFYPLGVALAMTVMMQWRKYHHPVVDDLDRIQLWVEIGVRLFVVGMICLMLLLA